MKNDVIRKVLDDSGRLYSLPQTLAEVLRVVKDETSTAKDLADILTKDPAMTTKILRVVNSPFYGVARQIGSVSQAVVTLGLRQVTALALSTSVYAMTDKWESCLDRIRFWRHSLGVAIASRTIAEKAGRTNLEEIFVAGLLHDIGLVMLEHSFPEQFPSVWNEAAKGRDELIDLEDQAWGTNHARVGQFLLDQWGLPEDICAAVGMHHNTFAAGNTDPEFKMGQIVNLANLICSLNISDHPLREVDQKRDQRQIMTENLGLEPTDLLTVEKHLFNQTINESKYLEMDIGSPEDILIESNRLLFDQYAAVEALLDENRRMHQQAAGEQVRRGFLESIKDTTHSLTQFVAIASRTILERAQRVREGITSGIIRDPEGVVLSSVESIEDNITAVNSLVSEMQKLSSSESSLNLDQQVVKEIDDRIRRELDNIQQLQEVHA